MLDTITRTLHLMADFKKKLFNGKQPSMTLTLRLTTQLALLTSTANNRSLILMPYLAKQILKNWALRKDGFELNGTFHTKFYRQQY